MATLVWEGLTNRDIANVIGTSEQVVKNYLRTTFDKLGVLEQAGTRAVRRGSRRSELGNGTRSRHKNAQTGTVWLQVRLLSFAREMLGAGMRL